jgi:hypothetical protein
MPCVTGQYSESLKNDNRVSEFLEGAADLSSFWSQLMFTLAILGSIAVGGLLAATAYCIYLNEMNRIAAAPKAVGNPTAK